MSHMVPQGKGSFHEELSRWSRGASDARDRICSDLKFIRVKSVHSRDAAEGDAKGSTCRQAEP